MMFFKALYLRDCIKKSATKGPAVYRLVDISHVEINQGGEKTEMSPLYILHEPAVERGLAQNNS
jgi:hypothetical protein